MERALCPVLVGREAQLNQVEDALLAANRGDGQIVVLAGEAGLGKTRLATEVQRRARKLGMVVLWGGCSEADLALPYLPFLEAIGNYLATSDLAQVREQLGPVRRELAHLFPQLDPELAERVGSEETQAKLRLFEAVLALLGLPARHSGVLLVLEDLHWADASTRELLDYLSRRLRGTRVLLLGTYRSDELHRKHPLLPTVQGWRRSGLAQIVDLKPLPPAGVADMVCAIFDEDQVSNEFRDFLHARSEGNPFVLEEFLKSALDSGDIYRTPTKWERKELSEVKLPQSVTDTILLRVERLSEDQVEVLRAAAVLGRVFAYPTLVGVSNREPSIVKSALQSFVHQQLLEEVPQTNGRYQFRHALTREAIYEDMIAPDRADLHARAAEALREQSGVAAVDLAQHLLASKHWDEAIPVCIKAAEEAERLFGYREAAELYERILPQITDPVLRGQTLCRLGFVDVLTGDNVLGQRYLEEGITLLEQSGQRREAARYRLWLGRAYRQRSRPDLDLAECEKARASLEPDGPSEDLANAYVRLASLQTFQFEWEKGLALAQRAVELAKAAKADAPRIWAYNFIGLAMAGLGKIDEGLAYLDRSCEEAIAHGLAFFAINALHNGIDIRVWALRPKEALGRIQRLYELVGRHQSLTSAMASYREGAAYLALGEPERARQALESALPVIQENGASLMAGWAQTDLARVYMALGRLDDAARILPKPSEQREAQEVFELAHTAVRLHLETGQLERARGQAQIILSEVHLDRRPSYAELWAITPALQALLEAGELTEAENIWAKLKQLGLDESHPLIAEAEGRLAMARGVLPESDARLDAAATGFAQAGYRLDESRVRRALARVKAMAGDQAGAEAELRKVLGYAAEFGAILEGQHARAQLAELGIELPAGPLAPQPDSGGVGERLVTVMFIDVRGYTGMTSKQAPQDLVDRVGSFHRWSRQEIERQHGLVDKFAGDAVMATFNVSGTRVDHCVQALQAAVAIRDKAAATGLPVGTGIAVGAAVIGTFTQGANLSVVGEVTNLASRLQAQAAAGEILLSEEAHRRVQDWLASHELVPQKESLELKGFEKPVTAYRLRAGARSGLAQAP